MSSSLPRPGYPERPRSGWSTWTINHSCGACEAFIAEVPELPGCATDGGTRMQALENVETGIQQWIETARELGRPIPEPKGRLLFA